MTRKIFRSILLVAGVVLAAGMVIMTGCLYSYFGGVQEQQLQDELSLAVSGVENGGTAYLERLQAERFRLTWIASDGRVLYDTQVVDVASMENHAGRQEVQEALADEGIPESDFAALCTEPPGEERPDGLYTLRYGEIQIMAIAKIQQMAEEIAKLKEQVAALSAGKE